jgi:prepilin-type N-terminal cleavage/methylation domain-containing protein
MKIHQTTKKIEARSSLQRILPLANTQFNSQVGLTLIECLVAIVIVALAGAIVAPAMVLSVATRVQSQRAEQALEIAQSEIDSLRVLIERGDDYTAALPPSTTVTNEKELAKVVGPNSIASTVTTHLQARPVDIDDDGSNDYAIQTFRSPGRVVDSTPVAFTMGVRVYDFDAVSQANGTSLPSDEASLAMTSGEGERSQKPLATLYTTIAVSQAGQSFCDFIGYLDSSASTPVGCIDD